MTVIDILIGKSIKKHREINAMSQRELARRIAVAAVTLDDYESGRRRVSPQRLFEIAAVLAIDVESLFDQVGGGTFGEELGASTPNIIGKAVDDILVHYDSIPRRHRSAIFSFLSTAGRDPD